MKFSFRIFLGLFSVIALATYTIYASFVQELRPGLRQSAEHTLIEIANLLAETVQSEMLQQEIADGDFAKAVRAFQKRHLNARIWSLQKRHNELQIYITNANGIVIFDSTGLHTGEDYSQWNDVYLTLRGQYGARSTLADRNNPLSSVMHVAAPIFHQQTIIGVLTVSKPNLTMEPFFKSARQKLLHKTLLLLIASLLVGGLLSWWLAKSVSRLSAYARAVQKGQAISPPKVHGSELTELAIAMTTMKEKLEGKQYVEHYVQALAHQLKTPIAAIQGATELLLEDMSAVQRNRFLGNIQRESERMRQIVNQMLNLAELENSPSLQKKQTVSLTDIIEDLLASRQTILDNKNLSLEHQIDTTCTVFGDAFLLQQALGNLLDNAIDFSPQQGVIAINSTLAGRELTVTISDQGSGFPDYAEQRLFERFYSLPRPGSKQKSSGLGLCLVKEIVRLHDGKISLQNQHPHGVKAQLMLPAQNL